MKIQPVGDVIFLSIEKANLGALDTSSVKTGMEWAIIKALGPDCNAESIRTGTKGTLKIGDKVFVKAWGVDVIEFEGESYYFTSEARNAICAVIK